MGFDVQKVRNECVAWIREWFEENGKGCNASTHNAATTLESLPPDMLKERIYGAYSTSGN